MQFGEQMTVQSENENRPKYEIGELFCLAIQETQEVLKSLDKGGDCCVTATVLGSGLGSPTDIVNEVNCFSHSVNTLRKWMNPTIPPITMDKYLGRLSSQALVR